MSAKFLVNGLDYESINSEAFVNVEQEEGPVSLASVALSRLRPLAEELQRFESSEWNLNVAVSVLSVQSKMICSHVCSPQRSGKTGQ